MTDDMIKLGKRAVACRGWRWMPGMRVVGIPSRTLLEDEDGCGRWIDSTPTDCLMAQGIPDLTDPATLGCLLALVREAYGDPYASIWYSADHNHSGDRWSYYSKVFSFSGHATEAEALVAALEGAP